MKYTNVLQKSLYSGIIFFSLSISKVNSQTFFIKETFSGASDSTAPSGWNSLPGWPPDATSCAWNPNQTVSRKT